MPISPKFEQMPKPNNKFLRLLADLVLPSDPADAAGDLVGPMMAAERVGGKVAKGLVGEAAENFKRWFGDSKVVDEAGDPLRVFHGTQSNFDTFDKGMAGTSGVPKTGKDNVFFFTDSPYEAGNYAQMATPESLKKLRKEYAETGKLSQLDTARSNEVFKEANDAFYNARNNLKKQFENDDRRIADIVADFKNNPERYSDNSVLNDYLDAVNKRNLARVNKSANDPTTNLYGIEAAARNQSPNVMPTHLSLQNPLIVEKSGSVSTNADVVKKALRDARANGNDGIIIKNTRSFSPDDAPANHYIAFEPTQIKSSTGNRGTYDPNDPSIMKSLLPYLLYGLKPSEKE